MNKYVIVCFIACSLIITPRKAFSQDNPVTCADIKTGIFYFYPKNASNAFTERRDADYVYEKNTANGDSTAWRLTWKNDCEYVTEYAGGNAQLDDVQKKFLKQHKLVFHINTVTNEYYTFTGYVDKSSNQPITNDTIWFSPKVNLVNNKLFTKVNDPAILKRDHFGDMSKYAVLYIYRPGKFTNSLGSHLVYFDENIMCLAKNKSGYIFKIFKEGVFDVTSRALKDASTVKLDVKFGNVYYVKSMVHWRVMAKHMYNFELENKVMTPEEGITEFAGVNLQ